MAFVKAWGVSLRKGEHFPFGTKTVRTKIKPVLYKSKRMILQVRKDIVEGRLGAPFSTLCLLTSYVAQAVIGDHDFDTCRPGYLAQFRDLRKLCLSAASNQLTQEDIERRISELHKLHKVC